MDGVPDPVFWARRSLAGLYRKQARLARLLFNKLLLSIADYCPAPTVLAGYVALGECALDK